MSAPYVGPPPQVWRLRNVEQMRADLSKVVDDGSNLVGPEDDDQMQANFAQLAGALSLPEATGTPLNLFARPAPAVEVAPANVPAASASVSAPAPATAAPSPWSFNFGAPQAAPAPTLSPAKNDEEAVDKTGKGDNKKGGGQANRAAGKAGVKARGRPKRDLRSTVDKFLEAFKKSGRDSAYFHGKESCAHKKWIDTLVKDVDDHMKGIEDADSHKIFLLYSKQLHCVSDILRLAGHAYPPCRSVPAQFLIRDLKQCRYVRRLSEHSL